MTRSPLFTTYVVLAVAGAIVPYLILVPWLARHGLDLPLFASGLVATGPAAMFSIDAIMASAVFLIFIAVEGRRLAMRRLWLAPLLVVVFGLSCALPAFLAMRDSALQR